MADVAGHYVEITLGLILLGCLLFYKYMTSEYMYWKKRNVPYIEPSFPFGNIKNLVLSKISIGDCYRELYDQMPDVKYFGMFELGKPVLVIKNPDLVKAIVIKDFNHFLDRGHVHEDVKKDFLLAGVLFNLKGEAWKRMRAKLSPMFTSTRMKLMFELMKEISNVLGDFLKPLAEQKSVLEFKDLMARFTSDIISSCAFGIESDSVTQKDSEVRKISKVMFPTNIWNVIKLMMSINTPWIYDKLRLEVMLPEVKHFCMKVAVDSYNYRLANNVYRNDLIDLLIKIKQNKNLFEDEKLTNEGPRRVAKDDGLTFEEMASQILIILAGGFETSSTVSSTAMYEMAMNPEIQKNVREEIDEVIQRHGGKITYESLKEMKYTEQVIYEALRRYPPVSILTRKCTKTYKVPDSDLVIEKGTRVIIPLLGLQHDPLHFPDPYRFDPGRFIPEQVQSRHPFVFIPFGEGPMVCIGKRFGKMQVKCAIATILSQFELSIVPETPLQLTIDPRQFLTTTQQPILLRISKRI